MSKTLSLTDTVKSKHRLNEDVFGKVYKIGDNVPLSAYLFYLLFYSSSLSVDNLEKEKRLDCHNDYLKDGKLPLDVIQDIKNKVDNDVSVSIDDFLKIVIELDDESFNQVFGLVHSVSREMFNHKGGLIENFAFMISLEVWKNLNYSTFYEYKDKSSRLYINMELLDGFAQLCIQKKYTIKKQWLVDDFFKNVLKDEKHLTIEKIHALEFIKPFIYINFSNEDVVEQYENFINSTKKNSIKELSKLLYKPNKPKDIRVGNNLVVEGIKKVLSKDLNEFEYIKDFLEEFLSTEQKIFAETIITSCFMALIQTHDKSFRDMFGAKFFTNLIIDENEDGNLVHINYSPLALKNINVLCNFSIEGVKIVNSFFNESEDYEINNKLNNELGNELKKYALLLEDNLKDEGLKVSFARSKKDEENISFKFNKDLNILMRELLELPLKEDLINIIEPACVIIDKFKMIKDINKSGLFESKSKKLKRKF